MNAALLRLSVRHADHPGIRLWSCADGTTIAAVPGELSFTGRYVVMYDRADWDRGTFFGYPTRPEGDEDMRRAAREFIMHNGCAPGAADEETDSREHELDQAELEPGEEALRRALEAARASSRVVDEVDIDGEDEVFPAEPARGERWIEANLRLKGLKESYAETSRRNFLTEHRWVRIMCDYSAEGVWAKGGGGCGVDDLPVSAGLVARIRAWQRLYESMDWSIDVREREHGRRFSDEGLAIAEAVKSELPNWTVVYHDEEACEVALRADDTPRSLFEYEIHGDEGTTRMARLAAIAKEAGLVAGETLLCDGDVVGTFQDVLDVRECRVSVSVETSSPVDDSGTHGRLRQFCRDWIKICGARPAD